MMMIHVRPRLFITSVSEINASSLCDYQAQEMEMTTLVPQAITVQLSHLFLHLALLVTMVTSSEPLKLRIVLLAQ